MQEVPGGATGGIYYYMAHTGDYTTSTVYHETIMPFRKDPSSDLGGKWTISPASDNSGPGPMVESVKTIQLNLKVSPNPFNPITVASYELRVASYVILAVYNVAGRKVAELVNGWRDAGAHEVTFDASGLPSGVYFAKVTYDGQSQVQKLMLIK
jgi:hypothetical protein